MSYKIEATPNFLAEAKKLSKKYSSLRNDIESLNLLTLTQSHRAAEDSE
jgi:mRNA-degrading endonuclease RelE of RelBE toxin-antitoxin system